MQIERKHEKSWKKQLVNSNRSRLKVADSPELNGSPTRESGCKS